MLIDILESRSAIFAALVTDMIHRNTRRLLEMFAYGMSSWHVLYAKPCLRATCATLLQPVALIGLDVVSAKMSRVDRALHRRDALNARLCRSLRGYQGCY